MVCRWVFFISDLIVLNLQNFRNNKAYQQKNLPTGSYIGRIFINLFKFK